MIIEDILRISDGEKELEIVFNPFTLETKVGGIELSKIDLVRLTTFLDGAISAKNIKESREKSIISKILGRMERDNYHKGLSINWI